MEEGEGERISLPRKDVRSHSFDSGLRDSLLQGNGEEEEDFATSSNDSNRSWSQRLSYNSMMTPRIVTFTRNNVELNLHIEHGFDLSFRQSNQVQKSCTLLAQSYFRDLGC